MEIQPAILKGSNGRDDVVINTSPVSTSIALFELFGERSHHNFCIFSLILGGTNPRKRFLPISAFLGIIANFCVMRIKNGHFMTL